MIHTRVRRATYPGKMYIAGGGEIMGGAKGNVDGATDWFFDKHFTAVVKGQEYDLLFLGRAGGPTFVPGEEGSDKEGENSFDCWKFGSVLLYEGDATNLADRYTKDRKKALEYQQKNAEWVKSVVPSKPKPEAVDEPEDEVSEEDRLIASEDPVERRNGLEMNFDKFGVPEQHRKKVAEWLEKNLASASASDHCTVAAAYNAVGLW